MAVEQSGLASGVQTTRKVRALGAASTQRFDLARFDLSDMIECGRLVRGVGDMAGSMEAAAQAIVQTLHRSLADATTGTRNCALVRCFKTHRFGMLPQELAVVARQTLGREDDIDTQMPCLTLLATAGEEPAWNDRRESSGHQAIPLESVDFVERAPMIAALMGQMGLGIADAMYPDTKIILDAEQHAFNVFHVEQAVGAAAIPGQEFVRRQGIKSVLGLGGLLPSGDLFAIILFSRVRIPRETADLFRTIALGVKLALLPFTRGPVWASETGGKATAQTAGFEDEQLRSEIATLRLLIPALEDAALHQTKRLKGALADLQEQSEHSRQQGMRLTAMLEATNDAVFLLDREWRFTFLNGHAQELLGEGRDLLGTNIGEVFAGSVGNEFWAQYRRVMHDGVSVQFEEHYPAPLNKWFEVHAFPSEDGVAAFFRDVTERRETDAKLRQTEKLAATGRMAASIAHEINNPLESVTNLLYLLAMDDTMNPQSRDWVRTAESELQRVSEITTHMLRFYKQSTKRSDVDMEDLMKSVQVLFHGRITQAGVYVEQRYRPSRQLPGFAGELRQVFANLVGNALDACGEGCRLHLRVREGHCPVTHREGIRVTVADAGSGMSEETRGKLFEPFYTTKGLKGTGLGLWVSHQLVQKHEGTVRVKSSQETGKSGTVFSVFFPYGGAEMAA